MNLHSLEKENLGTDVGVAQHLRCTSPCQQQDDHLYFSTFINSIAQYIATRKLCSHVMTHAFNKFSATARCFSMQMKKFHRVM